MCRHVPLERPANDLRLRRPFLGGNPIEFALEVLWKPNRQHVATSCTTNRSTPDEGCQRRNRQLPTTRRPVHVVQGTGSVAPSHQDRSSAGTRRVRVQVTTASAAWSLPSGGSPRPRPGPTP